MIALEINMEVWLPWLFTFILIPIVGYLYKKSSGRDKQLAEMEKKIVELQTQVTPFWGAIQKQVADALHHPHPEAAPVDELLEKLEALTITPDERSDLKNLLQGVVDDPDSPEEDRHRAAILLLTMPLVLAEKDKIIAAAPIMAAAMLAPQAVSAVVLPPVTELKPIALPPTNE